MTHERRTFRTHYRHRLINLLCEIAYDGNDRLKVDINIITLDTIAKDKHVHDTIEWLLNLGHTVHMNGVNTCLSGYYNTSDASRKQASGTVCCSP